MHLREPSLLSLSFLMANARGRAESDYDVCDMLSQEVYVSACVFITELGLLSAQLK